MLQDFVSRGHQVTAIGAEEVPHVRAKLESWGVAYEVVPIRRAGLNPFADLGVFYLLYRTLRRLRPDLLLAYNIKPVVYGMLISKIVGIPRRYAMITGRGYLLQEGRGISRALMRWAAIFFYAISLRCAHGALFHNEDDRTLFYAKRMAPPRLPTQRIGGSGVDLLEHTRSDFPPLGNGKPVRFLMIGRLIRAKGVAEYVAAAKQIKAAGYQAIFTLVGPYDPSPDAFSRYEIETWVGSGAVEYLGPLDDVRDEIAKAHVVVLPSYSEGLPRSVLEGMAAGRAIITSDAPGCSDTIEHGKSGLIVGVRDIHSLTNAMKQLILKPELIVEFGAHALQRAQKQYDVKSVNADISNFLGLGEHRA